MPFSGVSPSLCTLIEGSFLPVLCRQAVLHLHHQQGQKEHLRLHHSHRFRDLGSFYLRQKMMTAQLSLTFFKITDSRASLVAQLVPAMRGTWGQSLNWEDPLEKEKATHSSILS